MKHNFEVVEIDRYTATVFVQQHHYSPVMPRLTKHFLGFYIEGSLVGVLTLGWGTQPLGTINKLFKEATTSDYYEIGKMCLLDELPRNSESQMIKATVKWIRKNTNIMLLYTMADGIMGKCGYCYQASNFLYGGSYFTDVYMSEKGEKVHPRSTKELLKENAIFSNTDKLFWLSHDFCVYKKIKKIKGLMFRYILPINKKGKKYIKYKNKVDWNLNYPKDKDLIWKERVAFRKYSQIEQPIFDLTLSEYNGKNINAHKR